MSVDRPSLDRHRSVPQVSTTRPVGVYQLQKEPVAADEGVFQVFRNRASLGVL